MQSLWGLIFLMLDLGRFHRSEIVMVQELTLVAHHI